jgi:8-oxo-dGTP diphosphatase
MIFQQAHPEYDAINWTEWQPKDRATLCFVLMDDQILLIEKKRGLGKGKVNAPGGRMEAGETPAECAVRETIEELHVKPLNPENRGRLRFQFKDGYSLECWIFSATEHEGNATETDEAAPLWTRTDRIPYDRMWADDILWLPHMLSGHNVEGTFLFDHDHMLGYHLDIL